MKKPPDGVKLTMEAVCILVNAKPARVKDPNGGNKMVLDYWGASLKLMAQPGFLQSLMDYDKDNIDPDIVAKVGYAWTRL